MALCSLRSIPKIKSQISCHCEESRLQVETTKQSRDCFALQPFANGWIARNDNFMISTYLGFVRQLAD